MSFRRRLFLTVTALLIAAMSANFVVSTLSAREHFSAQLNVLAKDAATSLAFSISHAAKQNDIAQIETMIGAVFDSGYYLSINYLDLDGTVKISRTRDVSIEKVPSWFVGLLAVPLSSGAAEVQSGWLRIGEIRVVAHPGYVIRELWRATIDLAWVYSFFLVLSYGLLGLLLTFLMQPLVRLKQQADEIAGDNYFGIYELPKVPEFRGLALAMNRLAERVRDSFARQAALSEGLRQELSLDPVTKLANRNEFDARLASWLESEEGESPATMCLISLKCLPEINKEFGREYADRVLKSVTETLRAQSSEYRYSILGRRSGTDFCLFVPGMFSQEAYSVLQNLKNEIAALPSLVGSGEGALAVGAAFTPMRSDAVALYSGADESLRKQSVNDQDFDVVDLGDGVQSRTASEWREVLELATEKALFSLVFQRSIGTEKPSFEVFCRLRNGQELHSAAAFWPLLERFHLHQAMDKLILTRALRLLELHPQLTLSVNVTPASIVDADFSSWLLEMLRGIQSETLVRLTLELRESVFSHYETLNSILLAPLQSLGVLVGVDRFGLSSDVLSKLHQMDLSYVKLDRRFIRDIDQSKDDRFYLKTLQSVCRGAETRLIVEGVERSAQAEILNELGFAYQQGFYYGQPHDEEEFAVGIPSI